MVLDQTVGVWFGLVWSGRVGSVSLLRFLFVRVRLWVCLSVSVIGPLCWVWFEVWAVRTIPRLLHFFQNIGPASPIRSRCLAFRAA